MNIHNLFPRLMAPAGDGSEPGGASPDENQPAETLEIEAGAEGGETGEQAASTATETSEKPPEEVGEVVVTLGDEPPTEPEEDPAKAPHWLKELRKSNREKDRRIRELEQRISAGAPKPVEIEVGPRPTMAGCDYDEDKFNAEFDAWSERKRAAEDQQRKRQEAEQASQAAFAAKLEALNKGKAELRVPDFEEAEAAVESTFSVVQRGILVQGAKNSAALLYALGKNPKKAKELAAISDPVSFTWALAQLETQLKVTPRRAAPVPERVVRGSSPGGIDGDQQLAKLRAEAEKTGDRTKVIAYMRQQDRMTAA